MITDYQLTVARSILSFSRAGAATQAQLLDSYRAIIQEYEEAKYHNREQKQNQGLDIDAYLDDPRHGQAEPINRWDY